MSDKFSTITVVLEDNVNEENIDTITNAISMVRGVLSARANQSNPNSEYIAEMRVRSELRRQIFDILLP